MDNSSEDELGGGSSVWDWIYDEATASDKGNSGTTRKRKATEAFDADVTPRIIGARKGSQVLRLGDAVLLKAARNEQWVALLCEFLQDETDDGKEARFMWFTSPKEIRNKAKRRTDAMSNEIYLTAEFDDNSLNTVVSKANVVSPQLLRRKYPSGRIPRSSDDNGKTFVCRRGVTARTATYTEEFVWEDIFRGVDDTESLVERVKKETQLTRGGKKLSVTMAKDLEDFVVVDGEDKENGPRTPKKKRQKFDEARTPTSLTKQHRSHKYTTPTHKRIIAKKPLEFTPLGTRILDLSSVLSSPYQIARSSLHVSAVPTALPCREEAFSQVYQYLESAIADATGSCIYISGMPGTGKTATVREVIAQLSVSVQLEELDDFIFVEINGMKVTDPHQSYSLLWEALMGERLSPAQALGLLEREFSTPSPRRVPCVVLMDELDQLVTKNQSVMYNFFNWPNLQHSRLIVLAVANTMDLPERTLSNKISSRLGLTRITFESYKHEQLIKIIESRLNGVCGNIVDPDAIQFASRKVAQVSGDARRALEICRRAVEIAELEANATAVATEPNTPSKRSRDARDVAEYRQSEVGRVTIATVQRAIREATSTPLQQFLRNLPLACKVLLAAMLARTRRTGIGECHMGDVIDEAKTLSIMSQLPSVHDFLLRHEVDARNVGKTAGKPLRIVAMDNAAMDLCEGGIILKEPRRGERTTKVRLNVAADEIFLALNDDIDVRGFGFSS